MRFALIHAVLCVVEFVISQYPSGLILAVDVVMNAAGRRELLLLHVHDPVKNIIFEKSGFGVIGIGVLSTCENAALADNKTIVTAHSDARSNDIVYLLSAVPPRAASFAYDVFPMHPSACRPCMPKGLPPRTHMIFGVLTF